MPQAQPQNIGTFFQFFAKVRDNSKFGQVSLQSDIVYSTVVSATLAEINAGKTLIVGIPNHYIVVVDFLAVSTGAFTTATSVDLVSDSVNIVSFPIAGLTNGAKLAPSSSGSTLGAGFNPLTMQTAALGDPITVQKTGSSAAGGTSIAFHIFYKLVSA